MRSAFGKKQSYLPSLIAVTYVYGLDCIYSGQDDVEEKASEHIAGWFCLAYTSPFCYGQMKEDFGYLRNNIAMKQVL